MRDDDMTEFRIKHSADICLCFKECCCKEEQNGPKKDPEGAATYGSIHGTSARDAGRFRDGRGEGKDMPGAGMIGEERRILREEGDAPPGATVNSRTIDHEIGWYLWCESLINIVSGI
jgi:hypothetical protein